MSYKEAYKQSKKIHPSKWNLLQNESSVLQNKISVLTSKPLTKHTYHSSQLNRWGNIKSIPEQIDRVEFMITELQKEKKFLKSL